MHNPNNHGHDFSWYFVNPLIYVFASEFKLLKMSSWETLTEIIISFPNILIRTVFWKGLMLKKLRKVSKCSAILY